jgi:hypothetical protein
VLNAGVLVAVESNDSNAPLRTARGRPWRNNAQSSAISGGARQFYKMTHGQERSEVRDDDCCATKLGPDFVTLPLHFGPAPIGHLPSYHGLNCLFESCRSRVTPWRCILATGPGELPMSNDGTALVHPARRDQVRAQDTAALKHVFE